MSAPKRRKAKTPARGKPWPPAVVDAAMEALEKTGNVTEARKLLLSLFEFSSRPPARSTIQAWAKNRGIEVDVDPSKKRDTQAATEARLARLDEGRQELSEILLGQLSRPAAEEIARRLQEARGAEALVDAARQAYQDALAMIPLARELEQKDPEENAGALKGAWEAVALARAELKHALTFRIEIRDLVGVLTRGLGDHLALEGLDSDEQDVGDLIVEFKVPRPDRRKADDEVVPETKLRVLPGGGQGG